MSNVLLPILLVFAIYFLHVSSIATKEETATQCAGWANHRTRATTLTECRACKSRRMSRPTELHRQPLAEPSVRLSPHSAPIRRTYRPSRFASERRDPRAPWPAVAETGWPGSCDL